MMDVKEVFLQCFKSFFDKKDKKTSSRAIKNENMSNKELGEELHKPIFRQFNERKVHSSLKDNIWGADLADMQLISIFNKGSQFL